MEFLHGLMTLWLDWFISEYCFIFWLPFYNSTWGEPVTKPLMFSYERHDDSGSWEMKCITRVQLYKYQQLLFCLLLGIISQCILTTSKFMVIKFYKICLKMMLFQSNGDGWWMLNLTLGFITIDDIWFTWNHTDSNSLEYLPALSESPVTNQIGDAIATPPEQWIQEM